MNNRFMDKIKEFCAEMKYDEFVRYCIFCLQEENNYIDSIWKEGNAYYVSAYDVTPLDCKRIISVIPAEDGPSISEQELYANHPEYKQYNYHVEMDLFQDMSRRISVFCSFAFADVYKVPPEMKKLKIAVDAVLWPIRQEYEIECKKAEKYATGTICYSVDSICSLYEWCCKNHEMKYFRNRFKYCIYLDAEIWDVNSLRGDYSAQIIVSKAIKYLCEANCSVHIKLWDIDSGFEILWLNTNGLIEKGKVTIDRENNRQPGRPLNYQDAFDIIRIQK